MTKTITPGRLDKPAPQPKNTEKILLALAGGHSEAEAARIAGVSPRTVRRRVADPLFRAELDERKRQVVQQMVASLTTASLAAVATLEAQLKHRDPYVAQKAAQSLLDHSLRVRETLEYADRIATLEERARELVVRG